MEIVILAILLTPVDIKLYIAILGLHRLHTVLLSLITNAV
ncbi:hypothetical protein COO91_09525 (plasmid) [Nostoc flagelliforme CCNUN1]|uniref:Uncharacterized protein n=1 Tax=Nostoc flagelliforme CCNUN1 TaxID=2038116 RepID=A0A2K8T6T3_9NOSO|nr:hypothetical protein COO91_09525 [Nostoc flagelliforme CCNUN1]